MKRNHRINRRNIEELSITGSGETNRDRRRSRSMSTMRKEGNYEKAAIYRQNGNYNLDFRVQNEQVGNDVDDFQRISQSLFNQGARLVNTRRPNTPLEPRRKLYGNLAPPGRPPSAINFRQAEFRTLPSLDPIAKNVCQKYSKVNVLGRSHSVESNLDLIGNVDADWENKIKFQKMHTKLPPLDNLVTKDIQKNLAGTASSIQTNGIQITNQKEIEEEQNTMQSVLKHQKRIPIAFKNHQTKSFDVPLVCANSETVVLDQQQHFTSAVNNEERCNGNHNVKGCASAIQSSQENPDKDGPSDTIWHDVDNNVNLNFPEILSSRKCLARIKDPMAQSTTETLLEMLKAHSGIRECSDETTQHIHSILMELYTRVKDAKGNWRSNILGGLYGLVECSSPKILLAVARVVLTLRVTGSNLTGACKLVFKVARNEVNDYLFIDTDVPELLIDALGRASPIEDPEACIYGYGSVRFLATANATNGQKAHCAINATDVVPVTRLQGNAVNKQKSIAQRLSHHGAVQLMVLHLQILNDAGVEHKMSGPPLHALYQLSAALRALAALPSLTTAVQTNATRAHSANPWLIGRHQSFDEKSIIPRHGTHYEVINLELACPHLVKAAEIAIGEIEIQANIVRTISTLSEHESCCETLAAYAARIGMLLGPCQEISNGTPDKLLTLLTRLAYILGNVMANIDNARVQFYQNDVAMEYLFEALDMYSKQKLSIQSQMGDSVIDVMIKLIRVVANMSVNPDVGCGLGKKPHLGEILLNLLITANQLKIINMVPEYEELLQAILGALHNLCYYQEHDSQEKSECDGSVCKLISSLSLALCDTIKLGPVTVRAEAMRVLGNMTRNELAREAFCAANGLKSILKCLQSDNYELRATSSGVLVNLLGDWERRAPFLEMNGHLILRQILNKAAEDGDWFLAAIVCQAFWNFLIDANNIIATLGSDEADSICSQLAEYLDDEKIFNDTHPNIFWEQFASVAADLLERIQNAFTPECSSDDDESDEADVKIDELTDDIDFDDKWKGRFKKWIEED